MMKKHSLLLLILTVLSTSQLFATSDDGGVISPILSYNLGARGYAMGGAFVALADDTTASFWNPAGLVQIHRQEVSGYFETLFAGSSFVFLGYTYPIWNLGVASGSIMYIGSGDIQRLSEDLESIGTFKAYQFVLNLSFAQKLSLYKRVFPPFKHFEAGANMKIYSAGIAGDGRYGIGLDLGVRYYPGHIDFKYTQFLKNMVFGLKINNFVPPTVKFEAERDWYLWDLNFGALYRTIYDTLNITMDFSATLFKDRDIKPRFGMEYTFYKIFKGRIGYNGEITTGLGVNLEDLRFDYAFGYNFDLGSVHHISGTYYFGEIVP